MSRETRRTEITRNIAQKGHGCACFNIRKTARVITQLYDEALRPTGLRVTQFSIVMATRSLEPVTLSRLSGVMAMDRTTLTRNLRPLEREGLISIEPGKDRRERQVIVTTHGQQVLAKAIPLWERLQTRFAERFGPERLQQFFGDLSELRAVSRSL
jgi:DNA-binding MarR family transcriptional regulator